MKKLIGVVLVILFILILSLPFWLTKPAPHQPEVIDEPKVTVPVKPISLDKPDIPKFWEMSNVRQKKRVFVEYLRPVFEAQNRKLLQQRQLLKQMKKDLVEQRALSTQQQKILSLWAKDYKEDEKQVHSKLIEALLYKVDEIPVELLLMQAANESGWGTSRFARQGYNFFGLWCYRKGCGFVPSKRNSGAKHEVAKFSSIEQGVEKYMRNLNRHYAYQHFREIRYFYRNYDLPLQADAMVTGLISYSQRGEEYIVELVNMIRVNRRYMRKAS